MKPAQFNEQEPVAWITPDGEGFRIRFSPPVNDVPLGWDALYTTPPPVTESHKQSTMCGEPVALEALKWIASHDLSGADDRAIALMAYAFVSKARFAVLEATGERA